MASAAASRLTWIPTSRAEARLDAYRLVEAVQAGDMGDAVAVQLARAESQGWDEVVRVLLFARFVESYMADLPLPECEIPQRENIIRVHKMNGLVVWAVPIERWT